MRKGTRFETLCILLGGILNIVFSIAMLGPFTIREILAGYHVLIGVVMLSLAFRLSNRRNPKRDAILAMILGLLSLNPYSIQQAPNAIYYLLGAALIPIIGAAVGLIKSAKEPPRTSPPPYPVMHHPPAHSFKPQPQRQIKLPPVPQRPVYPQRR